jgi:RNA polymerase sigma factor (sigma-70 family)
MSLSISDEKRLLELFEQKALYEVSSDKYIECRNEIFTQVIMKLDDYFSVLKWEWKSRFGISEEDGASIIHDGLLAAVETFKCDYKSRNRVTKFVTYLVSILKNRVRNYITLNYATGARAKRKLTKLPLNYLVSLDKILDSMRDDDEVSEVTPKPVYSHILDLERTTEGVENSRSLIDHMLRVLPERDRQLIRYVLEGYDLTEIAKKLDYTTPAVRLLLNRIAAKFPNIQNHL